LGGREAINKEDRVSGYYNNQPDSYGDTSQESGGGGLRKQLEDALAEIKKLRQDMTQDKRTESAEALLKGKGLDPALKDLIPDDMEPQQWVEKYAHLLGVKPGADASGQPGEEPQVVAPVEDDPAVVAERQALADIHGAAASGQPATVTSDVLERMSKIQDPDELMEFFRTEGAAG
jgi:hypothetical protein